MRAVSVLTLLLCARSAAAFASHLPLHHRTAGRIPAVRTSAGDLSSSSLEAVGGSWDVQPSSSSAKPPSPLAAAAVLGVGTSCMGTAYAKALKASVTAVWISAPAAFKLADPTLYIPAICTLGGALIGLLAANLQSVGMPNFIAKQQVGRSQRAKQRPALASALPLLPLPLPSQRAHGSPLALAVRRRLVAWRAAVPRAAAVALAAHVHLRLLRWTRSDCR